MSKYCVLGMGIRQCLQVCARQRERQPCSLPSLIFLAMVFLVEVLTNLQSARMAKKQMSSNILTSPVIDATDILVPSIRIVSIHAC